MAAPVGGITPARDEAAHLQRIEKRDENARFHAHQPAEIALAHGALVVEKPEELEVAGRELDRGMRIAQHAHGLLAEQRQKEAGARAAFLENAARFRPWFACVASCHRG